eukprot:CAMPEP_0194507140 /NCGR_PEP_ID=MMETSP0253-20130528/36201_1 /TAXON_ID=2966 /ORGANISM="Noctiluca scintillans" /LENGTH=132 /DNA_ID=CAMNT_0039349979 /DNA_START=13 /DNA_END=407 /DNA_ORIENTATION=-
MTMPLAAIVLEMQCILTGTKKEACLPPSTKSLSSTGSAIKQNLEQKNPNNVRGPPITKARSQKTEDLPLLWLAWLERKETSLAQTVRTVSSLKSQGRFPVDGVMTSGTSEHASRVRDVNFKKGRMNAWRTLR